MKLKNLKSIFLAFSVSIIICFSVLSETKIFSFLKKINDDLKIYEISDYAMYNYKN